MEPPENPVVTNVDQPIEEELPQKSHKRFFSGILALLLLVGIGITSYEVSQNQDTRQRAATLTPTQAVTQTQSFGVKQIENFDTLTFIPDKWTSQAIATPPLEGTGSASVTYKTGGTWANLVKKYSSSLDLRGKYLHLDVFAQSSTLNWPSSPTLKLMSGSSVVMESRLPVRVSEWTGLNFDISTLNAALLSKVDTISIYMADVLNPSSITFKLDDLYVSDVPLAPKQSRNIFIIEPTTGTQANSYSQYKQMENAAVHVTFRTRAYSVTDSAITSWDAQQIPYFYTIASSDFQGNDQLPTMYVPLTGIQTVNTRAANQGFYIHEAITNLASQNNWNWQYAIDHFDWGWLDQVMTIAKNSHKVVVWSEPALAWQYEFSNQSVQQLFAKWGTTLVPMFATNFDNLVTNARDYASATAGKYGMQLGESHQSWYFTNGVTSNGSLALARLGYDQNASYYQFEGSDINMDWASAYMLGVRSFSTWLGSLSPTSTPTATPQSDIHTSVTLAPRITQSVTPTLTPKPTAKPSSGTLPPGPIIQ